MGALDIVDEALGRAAQDPGLTPELHSLLTESQFLVPVTRLRPDPNGSQVTAVILRRDGLRAPLHGVRADMRDPT